MYTSLRCAHRDILALTQQCKKETDRQKHQVKALIIYYFRVNCEAHKQLADAHQSLTLTLTLTIHALHTDVLGTLHMCMHTSPMNQKDE